MQLPHRGSFASCAALLRRTFAHTAGLLALATLGVGTPAAHAADQGPSERAVTIIVPFAAGGSLDATARAMSEKLAQELKQPVVIVNRPGGGTSVGARAAAQAAPDGHTLFLTSGSAFGFMHLLLPGFDLGIKDFAPIAGVAINTSIFAVNPSSSAQTLEDLVKIAESSPKGLTFCTTGVNGLNHLQLEMFKAAIKKKTGKEPNIVHVPYNGVAPALTALRAGDVEACTLPYSGLITQLHGKDIRVLAVQRRERLSTLPDVTTTGEQGYEELDGNDQIVMMLAPAATPPETLARIGKAVEATMKDPAVFETLTRLDVQPIYMNSRDTRAWLEQDVAKISEVIRNAGLAVKQ